MKDEQIELVGIKRPHHTTRDEKYSIVKSKLKQTKLMFMVVSEDIDVRDQKKRAGELIAPNRRGILLTEMAEISAIAFCYCTCGSPSFIKLRSIQSLDRIICCGFVEVQLSNLKLVEIRCYEYVDGKQILFFVDQYYRDENAVECIMQFECNKMLLKNETLWLISGLNDNLLLFFND